MVLCFCLIFLHQLPVMFYSPTAVEVALSPQFYHQQEIVQFHAVHTAIQTKPNQVLSHHTKDGLEQGLRGQQ